MFSPARHHFGELQLAAPEREVLVWSGSPRDPREGRDEWSVLAWSPSPVKSRENGVRGQRDLPSARGAAAMHCNSRCYHRRHGAGSFRRESTWRTGPALTCCRVGSVHCRRVRDGTRRPGYFLEPRRSCSRGPLLLILCRDARRSRGVGGAAVPFAHIAYCRERASPTAAGGCEESAAAQRMMFTGSQRLTIALLTRCTASWRTTVTLVQPATVLRWHREGFRLLWRWWSRPRGRRPTRYATLIREMAARIQGGARSGFEVSCSSLESGSRNAPCSGT